MEGTGSLDLNGSMRIGSFLRVGVWGMKAAINIDSNPSTFPHDLFDEFQP